MFLSPSQILVVALCGLALPRVSAAAQDEAVPQHAEAAELLAAGKPAEALEVALLGLEYAPDDALLLQLAARACESAGDLDQALWFTTLARSRCGEERDTAKLREDLDASIAALTPELGEGVASAGDVFGGYAEQVFDLGVSLYKSKLYMNAVDLFARCEGTAMAGRAAEQMERVYGSKKAIEALLASGLDAPIAAPRKKSAKWIAFNDPKHSEWDDAWEIASDNYTVTTNMGYALAEDMSHAMEQMNQFYRSVFGYKERGGTMARCRLYVYAARQEFDDDNADADLSPSVKGFFMPGVNEVRTYDPRTDPYPGTIDALWSTLFHEASHQFTRAISSSLVPAWLNEGTASYFEGARLLPNGTVQTNLIPESRLRGLMSMLKSGRPTLKDVVSFFEPGSYPGEYYPVGWGLVYFLRNWENEEAERVYLPLYRDYLATYKSGGVHDPFERFVEYFVERAEVEGVETFEDFERHFSEWGTALYERHFGPPSVADFYVAQAARQREAKELDNAVESYRTALAKRRMDAAAYYGLAEVLEKQKAKDAAILNYRRALEVLRSRPLGEVVPGLDVMGGELLETCLARVAKLHRVLGERMTTSDTEFVSAAVASAQRYAAEGRPRAGLQLLHDGLAILPGDADLSSTAAEIREAAGVDLERWRRLPLSEEFWEYDSNTSRFEPGVLASEVRTGSRTITYRGELPETYFLEASLHAEALVSGFSICALSFGPDSSDGMQLLRLVPKTGNVTIEHILEGSLDVVQAGGVVPEAERGLVTLGLDRTAEGVEFFLQGKSIGKRAYAPGTLRGPIGFLLQGMRLEVTDVRVRY